MEKNNPIIDEIFANLNFVIQNEIIKMLPRCTTCVDTEDIVKEELNRPGWMCEVEGKPYENS